LVEEKGSHQQEVKQQQKDTTVREQIRLVLVKDYCGSAQNYLVENLNYHQV
jgi:hypothetical protein